MHQLYILFESAAGYGLFRTTEFEEVAIFMPEVQSSILDISKFRSIVFLHAFHPFQTVGEAMDNMQSLVQGKLHMDLHIFLENNVPKAKKGKQAVILGVLDHDLGTSITETLGIACDTSGVVMEVLRGIRFHLHKFIKGYKEQATITRSQLGLSHNYARMKLKIKFNRFIPQTINMCDQLDKDIITLGTKVRKFYSFHFPELSTIVSDIELYVKCVNAIKNRKCMPENVTDALQDILNESEKVEKIMTTARNSMGMDISEEDIENIESCIEQTFSLMKHRDETNQYLHGEMKQIAPNLSALVGVKVGAQLISQAGSLINLAKFPASTVQILGAEKSLFRSLKTKGITKQKFGSIKQSALIGKGLKGHMSRYLANKCSLASRIDCFKTIPTDEFGHNLKGEVEKVAKFHQIKKLGFDPDAIANEEQKAAIAAKKALLRKKKKEKKRQKLAEQNTAEPEANALSDVEMTEAPKQNKRKRKSKTKATAKNCLTKTNFIKETESKLT